ncbi:MAG: right-handed parallel beta-helix repeat-containing protein [Byssovorax sp.]
MTTRLHAPRRVVPLLLTLGVHLGFARDAAATTFVGGPMNANTTWTAAASPYEVTSTITVAGSARLTIEAGVVVRFRSSTGLQIGHPQFDYCESTCLEIGRLTVLGTAASPVLFTSKSGLSGDWRGVSFGPASDYSQVGASLSFLTVEKAGQPQLVLGPATPGISLRETGHHFLWSHVSTNSGTGDGLRLVDSELVFSEASALSNGGVGIRATGSHVDMTSATVSGNAQGGVVLQDVSGAMSKSHILGNTGVGVTLAESSQTFTDEHPFAITSNEISGNGSYAITFFFKNRPQIAGNTLNGNTRPGIRVTGGTVIIPAPWHKQIGESNFDVVSEPVRLTTHNPLVIDAGCVVRFGRHLGLEIGPPGGGYGTLVASGTPESPVVFTSFPGAGPGSWRGLFFAPNELGQSSLTNVVVEGAGDLYPPDQGPIADISAGIVLHATGGLFPSWENVEVRESAGDGMDLFYAALTSVGGGFFSSAKTGLFALESTFDLGGAEVSDNGEAGIFLFSNTQALVHDCLIHDNGSDGVKALSAPSVITTNTILNNGGYGVNYSINRGTSIFGNTLSNNLFPGVRGEGVSLTRDEVWSPQAGEPFLTLTDDITISNSAELRIEGGLTAMFPSQGGLTVGYPDEDCAPGSPANCVAILGSQLTVQGTAFAPVVLTSTGGTPGSWRGVFLGPVTDQGNLSRIDYTIIENAGQPRASVSQGPTLGGALTLSKTTAVLNNLTIAFSTGPGIVSEASSPLVKNSVVAFNTGAGLYAINAGAPSFAFGVLHQNAANVAWVPAASTLNANPLFVNAAAGNYTPGPGSPCIDSGTSVGLPFLGAAPNRGAIE